MVLAHTMNKIIVYEHCNFQGLSREFTSNVSNLIDHSFNDCISSLKIFGNPWVVYRHVNFKDILAVYEEGEYSAVQHNDTISSMELVTEDLTDPQITLYEHVNYGGQKIVVNCETSLCSGSFNDLASSHKVQRGAWILYEHANRGGSFMVARASHCVPNYGLFNDKLSHLHPLKPGRPIISAEVQWDKKEDQVKSVVIESLCGLNHGEHEQTFSTQLIREYDTSVTESFRFSIDTTITLGSKFEVDIFVKAEQNLSLSNTFTVERGSTNARTEKKSVRVTLPVKVPPHTKLTVNVVRKEVDVKVPVKLTITTGSHSEVEYGEYRCQCGTSVMTEFIEEKI
uniref:Beta/gamma crystallin 'Greek key' domain-containing protein n=2 Tax=Electrophorus electricus TaxID=8005 RepID=A0AAY5ED31_ELEEL